MKKINFIWLNFNQLDNLIDQQNLINNVRSKEKYLSNLINYINISNKVLIYR